MPPFHRVDDWGAFWRHDVIGWEGYWIFIFLTEMYYALAVIIWCINWLRVRDWYYWKEELYFAIIFCAILRFAPWNQELDYRSFTGDDLHNMTMSGAFTKMDHKMGFTWTEPHPYNDDARSKWAAIRMAWKKADTKLEAALWKIAWGFLYVWTMSFPTLLILCSFGMTKEKK